MRSPSMSPPPICRSRKEERRFLELLAEHLEVSKLVVAAIERGARARHRTQK